MSRFEKLRLRRTRRLTAGTTDHEHPAWSPDGRTLAFSAGSVDARGIYLVDRKGRFVDAVAPKGPRATRPRWAPDGRRLAFDALPLDAAPCILIQDLPQLGNDPQLLVRGRRGGAGHAAFSPDGRFVAFTSDDRSDGSASPPSVHIWLLDIESGERRQLTDEPGTNDAHPAFSPDGSLLAFHRYLGEHATQSSLFLLNVATGALMRITDAPAFDKHPCFANAEIVIFHRESPDGSQELCAVHAVDGDEVSLQRGSDKSAFLDAKQPAVRTTRRGGLRIAFAGRRRGVPGAESRRPYDLYTGELAGLDGGS
ncbi:PD40 domain-containing protein [bacterium]|nr:PD40 domain-containing protein [bacterium]